MEVKPTGREAWVRALCPQSQWRCVAGLGGTGTSQEGLLAQRCQWGLGWGGAGAGGGESSCWEEALGEALHFRAWCLLLGRKVGTKANSAPVSVYNGRLRADFLLDSRSQDP